MKRDVWTIITTLLSTVTFPRPHAGDRHRVAWQLALTMAVFSFVLACNSEMAIIHVGPGDTGSKALVFLAYVALVTSISFFLCAFNDRSNADDDEGLGVVAHDDAHVDVQVNGSAADTAAISGFRQLVAPLVYLMVVATTAVGGGFYVFFINP